MLLCLRRLSFVGASAVPADVRSLRAADPLAFPAVAASAQVLPSIQVPATYQYTHGDSLVQLSGEQHSDWKKDNKKTTKLDVQLNSTRLTQATVFHKLCRDQHEISALSLNTCTSCLVFRHLLSNFIRPFTCTVHLDRLAVHNYSSSCLINFEKCEPFSFIACWATCRMEIQTFLIVPAG